MSKLSYPAVLRRLNGDQSQSCDLDYRTSATSGNRFGLFFESAWLLHKGKVFAPYDFP